MPADSSVWGFYACRSFGLSVASISGRSFATTALIIHTLTSAAILLNQQLLFTAILSTWALSFSFGGASVWTGLGGIGIVQMYNVVDRYGLT
ncbi:hypothetical protein Pfo_008211 [Paulownia fortunei]|nr:hypothetical protein Pfo_008211 [Paulownia fortunei]